MKKPLNVVMLIGFLVALAPTFSYAYGTCVADLSAPDVPSAPFNAGSANSDYKRAMRFTLTSSCDVGKVGLHIVKNNAPGDAVDVQIYSEAGGEPDTTIVTGSNITTSNTTTGVMTYSTVSTTTLAAGNYWIVAHRTSTIDNTNYYGWDGDTGGSPNFVYANGAETTWALGTGSLAFDIVGDSAAPPEPPPSSGLPIFGDYISNASSTFIIVDNPNQDLFNGIMLFIAMFWFVAWYFRKP